jgi:hypothetical protein
MALIIIEHMVSSHVKLKVMFMLQCTEEWFNNFVVLTSASE